MKNVVEYILILGNEGSGKTSLLNALCLNDY